MRKNLQQIQNKGPVIGAATDEGRNFGLTQENWYYIG